MDTVDFLKTRLTSYDCDRTIAKTKGGWSLLYKFDGDDYPTCISFMERDESFLITLPIGNKIHDDFFSPEDRERLRQFIKRELCHVQVE